MKFRHFSIPWFIAITWIILILSACQPQSSLSGQAAPGEQVEVVSGEESIPKSEDIPLPTRSPYSPGELVDYVVQTGDTLPALANHFNTSIEEIMEVNPVIPEEVSTLPPGMPMKIPIYFAPFWGTYYQILPDNLYINGPSQVGFNSQTYLSDKLGWFNGFSEYASGANRSGAEIVNLVAKNFSISPRLLLALLEFQAGAVTNPTLPEDAGEYILGIVDQKHRGLYLQLVWAANTLNNGYYTWRSGELESLTLLDGTVERPDPWQNAATVALQYYFSRLYSPQEYDHAIGAQGFAETYLNLFGNPWEDGEPHIPGSLTQPEFVLPFEPGETWALTGGPHTGWGTGPPLAAIDFAPPSVVGGCVPTNEWVTAIAPGLVVRSEPGIVVLDLDSDGDERTGWVIFHLHVGREGSVPLGTHLDTGDQIGHPSCEGGTSTGTHIHLARKYNGEWIMADGPLPFNLEGWVAHNGALPYQGTLTRYSDTVTACECSDGDSFITAGERE